MIRQVEDLLEEIQRLDLSSLKAEIKTLYAIRKWAVDQLGLDYTEGDTVEIADDFADGLRSDSGWYAYREALHQGATGVVREIDFNHFYGHWYAVLTLDRAWAVGEIGGRIYRWWKGPASETPEGYEPPRAAEQERWPAGKPKSFALKVEHLRKVRTGRREAA